MKTRHLLLLLLSFFLIAANNLAYTGPGDRTITTDGNTCWRVRRVSDNEIVDHSCTWDPDIKKYDGDSDYSIIPYTNSTTITYDPASVSSSQNCADPGNAGWCRSPLNLVFSASEPIPGEKITVIQDNSGTICTIQAANGNCAIRLPEGPTHLTFWAVSSYGDTSLQKTANARVDTREPALSVSAPAPAATGWHKAEIDISASVTDATPGSGVQSVMFSRNGGSTWLAGPLHLVEGVHTLQVRALDVAGNQTLTLRTERVDVTPPALSSNVIGTAGNLGWLVSAARVTAASSDATSGIERTEYRLDSGNWQPIATLTLLDGIHTLDFRALDRAGWLSTSTRTVKVDATPPQFGLSPDGTTGQDGWFTSSVSLPVLASDATSGLDSAEYRVDGGAWQTGAGAELADGIHQVEARASDVAGNQANEVVTVKVDTVSPQQTLAATAPQAANGGWYRSDVTISLTATDQTSGVAYSQYRLDDGAWTTGSAVTITEEGVHTVSFRTYDRAGLQSTVSQTVQIDKSAPTVAIAPSGTPGLSGWYVSETKLDFQPADILSGLASFSYRVNGGEWRSTLQENMAEGIYRVEVRAVDMAGNEMTDSHSFQVDTTPPSAEITITGSAGNAGWYRSGVTISAVPSDQTSGVLQTEARSGNGDWNSAGEMALDTDGTHPIQFRVTDRAGLQTIMSRSVGIDQVPPQSAFQVPVEGSQDTVVHGTFTFQGQSRDVTSGLADIQLSTDNGATWQAVSRNGNGWSFSWDTTHLPNGTYPILARADDVAGNPEHTARVQVIVANGPPQVNIEDWWWVWESGDLLVKPNNIPVEDVTLRIDCGDLPAVVLSYHNLKKLPAALSWNRQCGNGTLAASGDYPVTLTACDIYGNCASDAGVIKVPFIILPPSATATPTPTTVPTEEPTASPSPTAKPSSTQIPTATPTPQAAPVEKPAAPGFWLWMPVGIVGLFLVFATNSLIDPRPAALRRLRESWKNIADGKQ